MSLSTLINNNLKISRSARDNSSVITKTGFLKIYIRHHRNQQNFYIYKLITFIQFIISTS